MPHSPRAFWVVAGALAATLMFATCTNPATPSPPIVPGPPPPPNTPPTIRSVTASRLTIDVNESIQLSAVVEDQESPVDTLQFLWTSGSGSFTGQGRQVAWQAPANLVTPANLVLIFTVIERYKGLDSQGRTVPLEFTVSRSVTVRVHDSPKELGNMSVDYLEKFANSTISPVLCLLDFSDSCRGKQAELEDVQRNRENFVILDHELGSPRVTSLTKYVRADISLSCAFVSRWIKCPPGEPGCVVGALDEVDGECRLTAVYEQARWWLCDSRFSSNQLLTPAMKLFFGSGVLSSISLR